MVNETPPAEFWELYEFESHPPADPENIGGNVEGTQCPICGKAFLFDQKAKDRWGNTHTIGKQRWDRRMYCPGCYLNKKTEIKSTLSEGHMTLDTFERDEPTKNRYAGRYGGSDNGE